MDKAMAMDIAAAERIHVEKVVREWWEMAILKELFESPIGSKLVFKGGTALRLAYGSPRFSDDLDFSCNKPVDFKAFEKVCRAIEKLFPELEITDLWPKHYTMLGEYRVREPWLERAFLVKVEVSKRVKKVGFESTLLSSPVTNLQALGNVYTIEQILKEKKEALISRTKSRDVFDLWFIRQKTRTPVDISVNRIPLKELTQELRKYLPTNYWQVIPSLAGKDVKK